MRIVGAMTLSEAWLTAKDGYMPPVEQAKLWALRHVLRKMGQDEKQYTWMSQQVSLKGGGNPGRDAVRLFFERVDADPEWFPGKKSNVGGRPREMTEHKEGVLAKSAMALKKWASRRTASTASCSVEDPGVF